MIKDARGKTIEPWDWSVGPINLYHSPSLAALVNKLRKQAHGKVVKFRPISEFDWGDVRRVGRQ